ncbi:uncharacterized protein [Palaemon carinicauda]|uniref:uncharacterized protein n=1 Tax=Palaemon carinicauda TaxID=392227 RepID=UPI0035B627F1
MALHQFKTKHYATNGKHKVKVSNSQRMDVCTEQDNYNPAVPQRRSNDPILLYKPSEVGDCPAQPYKEEEDDLFRSCHNDLIRDMRSNCDANRSQPRRKNLSDDYHYENKGKYSENETVENPLEEIHVQSLIRPAQHNHRASRRPPPFSESMKHHEHSEMSGGQTSHNDNSYQHSDLYLYQNLDSPYTSLNEMRSFAYYNSQEPLEVKRLQSFYHQMATHMQSTIICPVTGHQLPMHLLSLPNGVHHPGTSLRETLPEVGEFTHTPNYEFENAKRMLVDGVRLVCNGARETMDKMKSKSKLGMGYDGEMLGAEYTLAIDESCEDVCEKLNYIQSAFLQLAECNDPEILNEARRIIPADLLHRLLRQVQEHSLDCQEPQGIT